MRFILDDFKVAKILSVGVKFDKLKRKVKKLTEKLNKKSNYSYPYLSLLIGQFELIVVQDNDKSRMLLKEYKQTKMNENLNQIFGFKKFVGSDFRIIEAPYSKDEELIISYASSSFEQHIDYSPKQLEGILLTEIIPEPIRSIHSLLVQKSVGNILRKKKYSDLFMSKKDKYLLPMKLSLKVSFNLKYGFSYLAAFQFDKLGVNIKPTIIIQPQSLKILEITKDMTKYFDLGESIGLYSLLLKNELEMTEEIIRWKMDQRKEEVHLNEARDSIGEIIKWETYTKWTKGHYISMKTKSGKNIDFYVKLYYYPVTHLQVYVIWLTIFRLSDIQQLRVSFSKEDFERFEELGLLESTKKNSKAMINIYQFENSTQSNIQDESIEH